MEEENTDEFLVQVGTQNEEPENQQNMSHLRVTLSNKCLALYHCCRDKQRRVVSGTEERKEASRVKKQISFSLDV